MNFTISCEAFMRLSRIATNFKDGETNEYFRSVYIENNAGHSFAVASNMKLIGIEYLGKTAEADGGINIRLDPHLIQQCEIEAPYSSVITGTHVEALNFATLKTTFGYELPGCQMVSTDVNHLKDWRKVIPKSMPKKPNGALRMKASELAQLAAASPSGRIVFPECISLDIPVVIRDAIDPNWMGLFVSTMTDNGNPPTILTATLPDWLK